MKNKPNKLSLGAAAGSPTRPAKKRTRPAAELVITFEQVKISDEKRNKMLTEIYDFLLEEIGKDEKIKLD